MSYIPIVCWCKFFLTSIFPYARLGVTRRRNEYVESAWQYPPPDGNCLIISSTYLSFVRGLAIVVDPCIFLHDGHGVRRVVCLTLNER